MNDRNKVLYTEELLFTEEPNKEVEIVLLTKEHNKKQRKVIAENDNNELIVKHKNHIVDVAYDGNKVLYTKGHLFTEEPNQEVEIVLLTEELIKSNRR